MSMSVAFGIGHASGGMVRAEHIERLTRNTETLIKHRLLKANLGADDRANLQHARVRG